MKMQRSAPYLGIIGALALGVLLSILFDSTALVRAPEKIVIPATVTESPADNSIATTTTSISDIPVQEKNTAPKQIPAPVPTVETQPQVQESVVDITAALDASASVLRSALVNIICSAPAGGALHSVSGSGVIVDSKGIILTNAHIGQYFLLADRGVSCAIRSGSPAVDKYDAELIYISPSWIQANPNVLTQTDPIGTGEYDFAFLAISKASYGVNNSLPAVFPSIPLAITPPAARTPVVIASYGAQFLVSSQIAFGLFPTIVFGSVKDIFTFKTNTIDVLALGGSAAAQEGSSGGGVADASGTLVGTITTSTVSGTTDTRSLDAITASYIRAQYATETGQALDILLAKPSATAIADFAPQISPLESIITAGLK